MKKLLLAAALFIASDAAFAHDSVLSTTDRGTPPAYIRYNPRGPAEPPVTDPTHLTPLHVQTSAPTESGFIAFLYRMYLSWMR
jgi:hypothetical protein